MKLGLVLLLSHIDGDRIRYYAVFLAIVQAFTPLSNSIYCRLKDKEIVKWNFNNNITDYKGIIGFTLWMFIGTIAFVGKLQGAAMILNLFFGTIINAAFGLANQVFQGVNQFTTTLRQAAVPQIMKNQESNSERSLNLVYAISRYSY